MHGNECHLGAHAGQLLQRLNGGRDVALILADTHLSRGLDELGLVAPEAHAVNELLNLLDWRC